MRKVPAHDDTFVESQILSTLELLHYCRRFEESLFVFSFKKAQHCSALLMDLRVLIAARIKQILFCPVDSELLQLFYSWSKSGDSFEIIRGNHSEFSSGDFKARISEALKSRLAVVVAYECNNESSASDAQIDAQVFKLARELKAAKVVFPTSEPGLVIDGSFKGYPSIEQVRTALSSGATMNLPAEWISCLIDEQERSEIDLVLVEARRGAIFEEFFTHAGSGTLFTKEYPNVLRAAEEGDVRDIMALLQPYVAEGSLKQVSEDEIFANIRSFKVFSVNGQIVCAAALKDYGDSCELTKLCTLPRFQARGRARALVRALVDEAKQMGKSFVFALTVHGYVGDFFERAGFVSIDREELPEEWKGGYDLSRPSKAYIFSIISIYYLVLVCPLAQIYS